jgi:hypothetical protein
VVRLVWLLRLADRIGESCDRARVAELFSVATDAEKASSSLLQSVVLRIATKFVR